MNSAKVLVLGGNNDRWTARDREYEKDIITGVEAFVFTFGGRYLSSSMATLDDVNSSDIVIANTNGDRLEILSKLQQMRKAEVKWVTLIEGCATDYLTPNPLMKKILDASDFVNVINANSLDFFCRLTTAKCQYIGIPYPAEGIRAIAPRPRNRECIVLPPFFFTRQGGASYQAAKKIAHEREINLLSIISTNEHRIWPDERLFLKTDRYQREYLKLLSQYGKVYVDLDSRFTWGRNILDCAALGIPIITTPTQHHGKIFFPELVVESWFDTAAAEILLDKLLSYPDFYEAQVENIPVELFHSYSHEYMESQIMEGLYAS